MTNLLKSLFHGPKTSRRCFGRFALHGSMPNGRAIEILEQKTLLASQLVASDLTSLTVTPGQTIEIPVRYSTLDDNGDAAALRATLISANLHFDSSVLTFVESTGIFDEDIVVAPNVTRSEADSAVTGDDNDAATDTVLVSAYSDTPTPIAPENTGWPNTPSTEGTLLYTARFTVANDFSGSTSINFSANATGNVVGQAASFDFQSVSLNVDAAAQNTAPSFTSAATASVAENQTAAIDVDATDVDNDTITYAISGGADAALFSIDSASGVTTFNTAPDFEAPADADADNVYNFTVTADDGNGGTTPQNLTVTVTDVADNGNPSITSPATASVPENQSAAISVVATDPEGDPLTYSVTGTDASLFSVSTIGVITFNAAPDFEAPSDANGDNVYNLTVGVDDGNGGSTSQNLSVTVTDVRDTNADPVITSADSASVAENQTSAISVVATDADGDTLTYSLAGVDAALFSVSSTGVITFNAAPDFETPLDAGTDNIYNLTVTADDANGGDVNQQIAITVTDVAETGTGTIEGRKFNDVNGNGVRDTSESFLNGWTIQLVDATGAIVEETVTADSDLNGDGQIDPETEVGLYEFTVAAGTYTVQEVLQDGWIQTAPSDSAAVAAFELDSQNDLNLSLNDFEDWGGLGERWVIAGSGQWYYITPDGSVFEWDGSGRDNLTGTLQATLTPAYHDDLTLLTEAQPATNGSIDLADSQTVTIDFGNQQEDGPVEPPGSFVGDGNVGIRIVGNRHLILIGDAAANGVRIYTNVSGFVTVEGLGGTTIDGQSQPFVVDAWTSIPGDLRAGLSGGGDAIVVQDVQVGRHVNINTHDGDDFVMLDNVGVGRNFSMRSNAGHNTVVVQDSQIGNVSRIITGNGDDMLKMDNSTVAGRTVVRARGGHDLFVTQDSSYARHASYNGGRENDNIVVDGSNSFSGLVTLDGWSGDDAVDVSNSTTLESPARIRRIEADSIADVDTLLDSVMVRLSEAGLGDLI